MIKIKCKILNSKDTDYKLFSCEYRLSRKMFLTKKTLNLSMKLFVDIFSWFHFCFQDRKSKIKQINRNNSVMRNNSQTNRKCKKLKKVKFISAVIILTLLTNKTSFTFTISVYPFTVNCVEIYTVCGTAVIVISVPVCIINWRLIGPQKCSFIHTVC